MLIVYDENFDNFCQERYNNYLLACDLLGVTDPGDYWTFRSNNIEWLEEKYLASGEASIN